MIHIKRRKDLSEFFSPYTILIDGQEVGKIYRGEAKEVNINNEISYIQFKFQFFKTDKILVTKDLDLTIEVGSFFTKYFALATLPFIVIGIILNSYNANQDLNILIQLFKYIGIFFISILVYFTTFGHKKYLTARIL